MFTLSIISYIYYWYDCELRYTFNLKKILYQGINIYIQTVMQSSSSNMQKIWLSCFYQMALDHLKSIYVSS